jgi:hypothetical protein
LSSRDDRQSALLVQLVVQELAQLVSQLLGVAGHGVEQGLGDLDKPRGDDGALHDHGLGGGTLGELAL